MPRPPSGTAWRPVWKRERQRARAPARGRSPGLPHHAWRRPGSTAASSPVPRPPAPTEERRPVSPRPRWPSSPAAGGTTPWPRGPPRAPRPEPVPSTHAAAGTSSATRFDAPRRDRLAGPLASAGAGGSPRSAAASSGVAASTGASAATSLAGAAVASAATASRWPPRPPPRRQPPAPRPPRPSTARPRPLRRRLRRAGDRRPPPPLGRRRGRRPLPRPLGRGRRPAPPSAVRLGASSATAAASSMSSISASTVSSVGLPAGRARPGRASSMPRRGGSRAWTTNVRVSPRVSTSLALRGGGSPRPDHRGVAAGPVGVHERPVGREAVDRRPPPRSPAGGWR